jgi:hypothetical protein
MAEMALQGAKAKDGPAMTPDREAAPEDPTRENFRTLKRERGDLAALVGRLRSALERVLSVTDQFGMDDHPVVGKVKAVLALTPASAGAYVRALERVVTAVRNVKAYGRPDDEYELQAALDAVKEQS